MDAYRAANHRNGFAARKPTNEITKRRPGDEELASLYRTGDYMFDGKMLIWEYPRLTPGGDQLDLVEVIELDGPLIAYHRIYWGW